MRLIIPSLSDVKARSSAGALLLSTLTLFGCAHTPGTASAPVSLAAVSATPPPLAATTSVIGQPNAASACAAGGGTYLGDMKCRLASGAIAPILSGTEALRAILSSTPVPLKSPHAWALATTAIIFEFNRHRHDLLSGTVATPEGQQVGERLLSKSWNVSNRGELLTTLSWLQLEGHRAKFDQLGSRVDALSDDEFQALEARVQDNPKALIQLSIARQKHRALGAQGILAWDLVRYIAVCRWGYLAGYLSEDEAWDHIMPTALRLQQTFASWQDMQNDYLIGREYWSGQQTDESGEGFRAIYDRFLKDPVSPWNVNSWNMDLKLAAPVSIKAN